MYASGLLSRFIYQSSKIHFGVTKKILRYIQSTKELGLVFERNENKCVKLFGFCDSNWAGSIDEMKNTSDYTFTFGLNVFS
jgi:hypothetical protein